MDFSHPYMLFGYRMLVQKQTVNPYFSVLAPLDAWVWFMIAVVIVLMSVTMWAAER